jgi:branched-chain amino acid transport system substrate-binding protein
MKRFSTLMNAAAWMAASALLLTGAACAKKEVTVAVVAPMTGEQAQAGKDLLGAVQFAAEEWNNKGGVLGKKVVVISVDDKGDPTTAAAIPGELKGKADAVIGHYNSSCTLAAMEGYYKDRTLMITPSSTNPEITEKGYPLIFRVCGRDDQQGKSAAAFVASHFPGSKVAVLHDNSAYGKELANEFMANYEFLTKSKLASYGAVERSHADYSNEISAVKAKEPTLVYFGGLWPQGAELVSQFRKAGLNYTFVSGDGCFDPQFIKAAGANADGVLVTFIPDQEKLPGAKQAVAALKGRSGGRLGPYALYAYSAANAALQGMVKAQTTDPVEVAKALHNMEVETPFGMMKFDDKNDPQQSPYVMWIVQNGAFVEAPKDAPAAPAPAASPEPAK